MVTTIGNNPKVTQSVEEAIRRTDNDTRGTLFKWSLFGALGISTAVLAVLIFTVIQDAWPILTNSVDGVDRSFSQFLDGTLRSRASSEKLGISQGIVGTFWIAIFVILISFPTGIAAAIYLEEYAPRNWFTSLLDIIIRNLAGVPSVVYGLLGLFLFVKSTGYQSPLFAGGFTLAILVLPIVIITGAEAIRAVPDSLRQGAYGVGATKWEVIRDQVLPFAAPGILTGTLLSLARAVGEAAPLILVGAITGRLAPRGSMFESMDAFFSQFTDKFTAMPIVISGWVANAGRDPGFAPAAGAAIVVLLVFVIAMNSIAVLLRNHFEKKRG